MGKLIIVPTPIGNLEDITYRAVKVLQAADVILAEDTRKTNILLTKYQVKKRVFSHHKFNEYKTLDSIIERLEAGEMIALVSDAGTPSVSDPGRLLVKACIRKGIPVECLPGPTALIPALVLSGFDTDKFCFEGFLPHKKGRTKRIKELALETRTIILYESPQRIVRTLMQLMDSFGSDRQASVARELTKIHEEVMYGTISQLYERLSSVTVRGEIVLTVEGMQQ
jgi:16S rRNA (cytidine1402-2'-O)-methyltransferase